MAKSFRPTWGATILAATALAVLLALGTWQVERLRWKEALLAEMAQQTRAADVLLPAAIDDTLSWKYRKVSVAGYFLHDKSFRVQPRTHGEERGYDLVTPLQRASGDVVFVNRGFVANETPDSAVARPQEVVSVIGRIRLPEQGRFTPPNDPARNQWYWVDVPAMAAQAGVTAMQGIYVDALPQPGAGYPVGRDATQDIPNNHLQYALFWYGMAAILAAIYFIYHWREEDHGPLRKA